MKDDQDSFIKKLYRSSGVRTSKLIAFPLLLGFLYGCLNFLYEISLPFFIKGFVLGVFLGFVLIILNHLFTLRYKDNPTEEDFDARHQRNVVLFLPYDIAFDYCFEVINFVKEVTFVSEDRINGIFKAETPQTLRDSSCSVIFQLNPLTETATEVIIKVAPKGNFVVFDFGRSLQLIETLESLFKAKNDNYDNFLPPEKFEEKIAFEDFNLKTPR